MKSSKVFSDDRGIAVIFELVLVAVVLGVGGYAYYTFHANMASKTTAAKSTVSPSPIVAVDASCVATYHDTNLCHFASNSTSLDKMAYTASINEVQSGLTSTMVLENDGKGNTALSGTSNGTKLNTIELGGDTYIQSGATWIKYSTGAASAADASNPTSSMNLGVGGSGVTYKEIDTEACGSLTCYKYQVTDSAMPNATQFAWFDNKSYLLRQWKETDGSGNTTDMTINYQPVTITAPSPVQSVTTP